MCGNTTIKLLLRHHDAWVKAIGVLEKSALIAHLGNKPDQKDSKLEQLLIAQSNFRRYQEVTWHDSDGLEMPRGLNASTLTQRRSDPKP